MNSGLASPWALYIIVLIPLLLWALYASVQKRFAKNMLIGVGFRKFPALLFAGSVLVLLLLAICRPFSGRESINLSSNSLDIVALVDISPSMMTRDVQPSRLGFVRHKLLDLLSLMKKDNRKSRLSVITFSDRASLAAPMTNDFSVLPVFINSIMADRRGSASSLESALKALVDLKQKGVTQAPLALLFTDGNFEENDPASLLQILEENQIKLGVITVGTGGGAPVELEKGRFLKDSRGNIVISRKSDFFVSQLAKSSGGNATPSTLTDYDLQTILSITSSGTSKVEENVEILGEIGPLLMAAALLVIISALATGNHRSVFPAFFFLAFSPVIAQAQDTLRDGSRAYESGNYEDAIRMFEDNLKKAPGNTDALQALASSYYKKGDYAVSEKLFTQLSESAQSPKQKYEAMFNLGNALLMQNELVAAVRAYQDALKVKPGDEPASANLKYAMELERAIPPTPTPTPPPSSKSGQSSSQNSASQGSSSSQSEMNGSSAGQEEQQQSSDSSPGPDSPQGTRNHPGHEEESSKMEQGSASSSSSESERPSSAERDTNEESDKGPASIEHGPPMGTTPSGEGSHFAKDRKQKYDSEDLKREEAEAWLRSLPDSPKLLYRPGSR